ncbi:hypothetical protein ATB53_00685 [Xanthomonas translucens]|nr:hypothetical protein ATB53_00685 [Xanthomonas translucens]
MLKQPIDLLKPPTRRIIKNYWRTPSSSIYIRSALHQKLHVLPLVVRQECLEKQGFIIGIPCIRITTMIQQQLQIDRIFLLSCPYHGIFAFEVPPNATILKIFHFLIRLARIRIGPILQHRPQPIRVVRHDWPHQQRIAVCGEDHVRVDVLLFHQPPDFLGIAMLSRKRQRLRLGVGEERGQVVGRLLIRWRHRQRIAASAGQQQE